MTETNENKRVLDLKEYTPLETKIVMTKRRIKEWYYNFGRKVYVGFSGGKDSTVLLHIARSIFPDIKATFVNTGLEYPEIVHFAKSFNNVDIITPKRSYKSVIESNGYPVISKMVSMAISRYRNTKREDQRQYRLYGKIDEVTGKKFTAGTIPKKWHYMIDAPFRISEMCCNVIKKQPFVRYQKQTGLVPIIGTMAVDSANRNMMFQKQGCNVYGSHPKSMPLSFWTEKDIWDYIKTRNIEYCKIYDIPGIDRTGCMGCMYGCHMEKESRFKSMSITHPRQYDFYINELGQGKILDYCGVTSWRKSGII